MANNITVDLTNSTNLSQKPDPEATAARYRTQSYPTGWGNPKGNCDFGNTGTCTTESQDRTTISGYVECWRMLDMALFLPGSVDMTGERLVDDNGITIYGPNGETYIKWTGNLKTGCDGQCGTYYKLCLCPYSGPAETIHGSWWSPLHPNCVLWSITKFNKEHDDCPPDRPCDPDYLFFPFPAQCPGALDVPVEVILEVGVELTDQHCATAIQIYLESFMDYVTDGLPSEGYNMKCDGGLSR